MRDENDSKTGDLLASSNAKRQAKFAAKRQAEGWRRITLWVREDDYQKGRASFRGEPGSDLSPSMDSRSYWIGVADEHDDQARLATKCKSADA